MGSDEVKNQGSEKHEGEGSGHEKQEHKNATVIISVNEQPVELEGHMATGAEIKAAAIAQGVRIQLRFVLQEELPNGTSRIVGDNDKVHLREHLRFTAIAPDDNS
jgi:hypothetical protein